MSLLSSIPAELITAGFSAALGGIMSYAAMKLKQQAQQQKFMMDRFNAEERSRVRAEANDTPAKRWTRRAIALTCTVSVMVVPMVAGMFGVDVIHGWTEMQGGFWPFTEAESKMVWHVAQGGGIVITPLHTHTFSAIIGFYFGGSVMENARIR